MAILVCGAIGIAMVVGFLGFMLWWVPAFPLIVIVVVCMSLLILDFVQETSKGVDKSDSPPDAHESTGV